MATNKQALLRYKTIDKCLQNRLRKWTLDDLIEAVADALYQFEGKETGIARRTIQQDIQVMRSDTLGYNAPIIVTDKRYYTYEDKEYSIAKAQMSPSDVNKLNEIVQVLKQFSGFGYFEEMSDMITKLENNLAQTVSGRKSLVQFETNPLLKGIEFINPLYQAISNQLSLNIKYKSFKAKSANESIYFPYLLKEYRNRWFIIVKPKKGNLILTLALDRIESFSINETEKFVPYKGVDFETYFADIIGVTRSEKDRGMNVIFKVHPAHAPYVITKPLHATQQVLKQEEDGTIFKICVILNFELERELIGFGEFLKVLGPRMLVNRIQKRTEAMHKNYNEIK